MKAIMKHNGQVIFEISNANIDQNYLDDTYTRWVYTEVDGESVGERVSCIDIDGQNIRPIIGVNVELVD